MIGIDTLLAWGATYKKVTAGETIFSERQQCIFYHQLAGGSVRWVDINDEGKEFIHDFIQPGECFGEFPLFDDSPYASSAIANENSVVIRLHKSSFLQLLKEEPEIHFEFDKMLTQRLRFKFLLLKELACADSEHRISILIDYFKQSKKNICPKCNQIKLTRQQIADMTGLRVETVIRSMRHLHEKGEIKILKGKVYCKAI
ncbi:MAG: Crp/Fnr family transcriptional regulator [Bacteroidetes bacterium]|nr:Crp/Fnr family transcriptional regulator [Bacteroidota bacterium]MBS1974013.1 Crp/Fnr family transcriptional regulator [Bacteroidota bacterium]